MFNYLFLLISEWSACKLALVAKCISTIKIHLLIVLNLSLFFNYRFPWYDLEENKDTGTVLFRHDSETTFTPEELLGMILNHSRIVAEKFAG